MTMQDAALSPAAPTPVPGRRAVAVNLLLVLLSAGLTALAFPPCEVWPLAWVALAPLLFALRRTATVRAAGWLMLLWGLLVATAALHWMAAIFSTAAVGVFLLIALPWVLFGLAYRVLIARAQPTAILLLTPILWLACDWLRCEGWYFQFSWLQLGFTQVPFHFSQPLFPVVGTYGVTFFILLVNAALLAVMVGPAQDRKRFLVREVPLTLLVLALLTAHGYAIRNIQEKFTPTVTTIIVQDEDNGMDRLKALSLAYKKERAGLQTPALLVWPEYAVPGYLLEWKPELAEVQGVARDLHATLVLGTKERAPDNAPCDPLRRRSMLLGEGNLFYNTALIVGPDGGIRGKYHKAHPIQLFADGVPGRDFPAYPTPAGKLGLAICYDCDFAWPLLQSVRNGANILVVPTMDAKSWSDLQHRQHARMAQARAAELGRPMARATTSGVSQLLDAQGEELATIPCGASQAVVGHLWPQNSMTPYASVFFLLPYACLAVSLLWLLWTALALWRIRKNTPVPAGDSPATAN